MIIKLIRDFRLLALWMRFFLNFRHVFFRVCAEYEHLAALLIFDVLGKDFWDTWRFPSLSTATKVRYAFVVCRQPRRDF
jgi:hypothetical protein